MFTREKISQAIQLLPKYNLDVWITLCRETMQHKDPVLNLIYSGDTVWLSAFIIAKSGENIAIVGKHDADTIRQRGEFDAIIGYNEDFAQSFTEVLYQLDPQRIGLNYDLDDAASDGLTYGLWLKLQKMLTGTPYGERITSASPLINELRGVKSQDEIDKITTSVRCAEEIIAEVGKSIKPGLTEFEISQFFKENMTKRQVTEAWSPEGCPAVDCGPESAVGHSLPSPDITFKPGQLLHIDFGVIKDNYASDLQRIWYLLKPDEEDVPNEVAKAFYTVRKAITNAAKLIKPGILGHQADQIARQTIIAAGYPEFKYALGHQVGQKAHDGGTILGPIWPRYGDSPYQPLLEGNVFTLELGVPTSAGYVGLEEMIVVTKGGCKFISKPQEEIWLLK